MTNDETENKIIEILADFIDEYNESLDEKAIDKIKELLTQAKAEGAREVLDKFEEDEDEWGFLIYKCVLEKEQWKELKAKYGGNDV